MRVTSLGSGSCGNALLIEHGGESVLVDCGLGPRVLADRLRALGRHPDQLTAVLLTHEHTDHSRALPRLCRRQVPVLCTSGTAAAAGVPRAQWQEMTPGRPTLVAGLTVTALPVLHDAAEPCGYLIEGAGVRLTVLTDLGTWGSALAEPVGASDLIVLEANHDEVMLRRGPYPAYLQRRVLSERGHLSNIQAATALQSVLKRGSTARTVWLAHLSAVNNRPELAAETMRGALAETGTSHTVAALPRAMVGPSWPPHDVIRQVGLFEG